MRPLSINKLNDLITNQGSTILRYYKAKKYCAYVEIVSNLGNNVLISIPRKFKIKLDDDIGYKIYPLDMDDIGSISNAGSNGYKEIELNDIIISDSESNITKGLKESYKDEISLDKIDKDKRLLEKMYNLVNRLQYCFKRLRYKVAITGKKYMCVLERDKSIDLYYIKKYNGVNSLNMFIVVSLDLFFEKTQKDLSLYHDLYNIEKETYDILNKIQLRYLDSLNQLTSNQKIKDKILLIIQRKNKNKGYLEKLYILGIKNINGMDLIRNKLINLNKSNTNNVYEDTQLSMDRKNIEDQLRGRMDSQNKLKDAAKMVRDKNNNMYLVSDLAIYDNMVLADDIANSISLLDESLK